MQIPRDLQALCWVESVVGSMASLGIRVCGCVCGGGQLGRSMSTSGRREGGEPARAVVDNAKDRSHGGARVPSPKPHGPPSTQIKQPSGSLRREDSRAENRGCACMWEMGFQLDSAMS